MLDGYRGGVAKEEQAIRDELTARAAAFASGAVRELWQRSALASAAEEYYVSEAHPDWLAAEGNQWFAVEAEMEQDEELARLREAGAAAGRRLARQIRAELGIPPGELSTIPELEPPAQRDS